MFHKATFPKVGLDPDTLFPQVLSRPPVIFQDPNVHTIPVPKPLVVCDDRKAVVYTDGGSFINEAEEDLADALSPMYDQLKLAKHWWILEMIPQKIKYQSGRNDQMVAEIKYVHFSVSFHFFSLSTQVVNGYFPIRVNRGHGRHIPLQRKNGVKIHRSVKIRMAALGLENGTYAPKANLKVEPIWVD